jgi:hypothetical protein
MMVPFDEKELAWYYLDLGEKEYTALGFAGVQWAFLEEMLYIATARLYRRCRRKIPGGAKSLDFSRRVAAFGEAVKRIRNNPPLKDILGSLIPKMGNANGTRQKLTHGIWGYDAKNPMRLYSRSREGAPVRPHIDPFDIPKLWKFSTSVGELSLALDVLTDPKLPAEPSERKPYMSRSFLLAVTGKDPESLGYHWPKPREGSPLQGSSEEWVRKLKELRDEPA